ncbi:MAG: hypothetical protein ACTSYG_09980 [Candidatus Heimdallarchaeota archaeon]
MNVLLSVKPKFADEIIAGRKKYEFRKSIFKKEGIEKVYLYSSSPIKKIIAFFEIEGLLVDSPVRIWEICHEHAGISKRDFFRYFGNSDTGYAIRISNVREFSTPIDPYDIIEDFRPPQSFYYLPMNFIQANWNYQNTELNYDHGVLAEPSSGYSCQERFD